LAKIIIIGDSSVGKTNIMMRYVDKNYTLNHVPTIGVDFKSKIVDIEADKEKKKIKLQIWDTAGQERFRTITETYYNGASGIIVVYSINDRKSFNSVQNWLIQIAEHNGENLSKVIVGNKCDLNNERAVTYE
jgi:small GTP-binding protein